MKRLFALPAFAGLLFFSTGPCLAQAPGEAHQVQFAKGALSATLTGSIGGYTFIDYKLRASAGKAMNVVLNTNNVSNDFNVLPSGLETALFNGSTSGEKWAGTL